MIIAAKKRRPTVMCGADHTAIRKPSISGWRTSLYRPMRRNPTGKYSRLHSRSHPWRRPKRSAWLTKNEDRNTIPHPTSESAFRPMTTDG